MPNYSLRKMLAIGFVIAAFVVSASAQISIKDLKMGGKKPDPKLPLSDVESSTRIERNALENAADIVFPDVCDSWGNPDLGRSFRAPVKSNIPVLFN